MEEAEVAGFKSENEYLIYLEDLFNLGVVRDDVEQY
jgi:hypothetical protein